MTIATDTFRPAIPAALVAVLLLASPTVCMAQDHLLPETSEFGGPGADSAYRTLLQDAFRDAYGADVEARMIAIPAYGQPYAVAIRRKNKDAYVVLVLKWTGGDVQRCASSLDSPIAKRAILVWEGMLADARFVPRWHDSNGGDGEILTVRGDGDNFHFSMPGAFDVMTAAAWSPDKGTPPAMLVAVADALRDYCADNSAASHGRLTGDIAALEARLKLEQTK